MTRLLAKVAPWAAAWFMASAGLAWILWATGQNPAWALAYGWTGAVGAAGYVLASRFVSWRYRRQFNEDLAAHFLSTPRDTYVSPADVEIGITHEGLARLHRDIVEDEARRRGR